LYELNSPASD